MNVEQTGWLWEALRSGIPFERLVDGLGYGEVPDSEIPDFAAVVVEGPAVRVGVRGRFSLRDAAGDVVVSGEGAAAWNEELLTDCGELVLDTGQEAAAEGSEGLPIGDGLVAMSSLRLVFAEAKTSRRRSVRAEASAASPSAAREEAVEASDARSPLDGILESVPLAAPVEPEVKSSEPDFFIDSIPDDVRYPKPEERAGRQQDAQPERQRAAASRTRRGAHSWHGVAGDPVVDSLRGSERQSSLAGRGLVESASPSEMPAGTPAPGSGQQQSAETAEYEDCPLAAGGRSPSEDIALVDTVAPEELPDSAPSGGEDPDREPAGLPNFSWAKFARSGSWSKASIVSGGEGRIAGPLGSAVGLGGNSSDGQKPEQIPVALIPTANSAALASLEMISADSSVIELEHSHTPSPVDSGISASPLAEREPQATGGMPLSAISSIMPRSHDSASPSGLVVPTGMRPGAAGPAAQAPVAAHAPSQGAPVQAAPPRRPDMPRRSVRQGAPAPAPAPTPAGRAAGVRDQLSSDSNATAMVLALLCQYGHLNPPHGSSCRLCGAPIGGEPNWYPRPALGEIYLSTGLRVPIDADIIIGRKPASTPESGRPRAHLVPVPSPDQQISRIHCEIRVDGWDVRLVDRNSNNGTYVLRQGEQPIRIRPSEPFFVRVGDVVDIGEGVTIHMLGPQGG
ncbi:MAG: FHA domain-containing protein [Actinomycetaceae bacterium]|nr:FHA domain-containing protein [Actinomycetaceae bacterium]